MQKSSYYLSCLIAFCLIGTTNMAFADDRTKWDDQIVALPPLEYFQNRYLEIESEVDKRFAKYFQTKEFVFWKKDYTVDTVENEFLTLSGIRGEIWFNTDCEDIERGWRNDFRPSIEMVREDFVRNPNCIAFDFNKVSPYYNGSIVTIDGLRFLSLEGPLQESIRRFFYVLLDSNVPLLVRLTPEIEKGRERCAAYWKGRVEENQIAIPRHLGAPKLINYLATDDWKDNAPTNAELLLNMVLRAREQYDPSKGPLAVHCSGGVGRTGTFIAAYCLVHEIDKQISNGTHLEDIKVSIEQLVARLSIQRYHMVARPCQYLNLYQLVDVYLASLDKNK